MAILRERTSWTVPRPPTETRASADLTPGEQARVRVAIVFLRASFGSYPKLARAMDVNLRTLTLAASRRGTVSAGIALRTARAAGASLEDVLSGKYPPAGACPHCGHVAAKVALPDPGGSQL